MSRCSIAIGGDAIRVQGSGRATPPSAKLFIAPFCSGECCSFLDALLLSFVLVPLLPCLPAPYRSHIARWPAFPARTTVRDMRSASAVITTDLPDSTGAHCRHWRHWHLDPTWLHACCDARCRHAMGQAVVAHQHSPTYGRKHRRERARRLPVAPRSPPRTRAA
jgi:hypothetical protein